MAPNGSYSAGPPDITVADCFKASFELCLALPLGTALAPPSAAVAAAGQQQRQRVRVVHNLQRRGQEGAWKLDDVELHLER